MSWAGLLLTDDRKGDVIFGRSGKIERGRVLEEQADCDWILYPCDEGRRFGFGIIALDTTGNSDRLSNLRGDWCVLGLSNSPEPIQGLRAFAVIAIGPWAGTPEEYADWLRAWSVRASQDCCLPTAPSRQRIDLPYPS